MGALYVRHGLELEPVIYGGGQEAGRRAGTENVASMVALGTACMLAHEQLAGSQERLQGLRDGLQRLLEAYMPAQVHVNGHATERLPNPLNFHVEQFVGQQVSATTPILSSTY